MPLQNICPLCKTEEYLKAIKRVAKVFVWCRIAPKLAAWYVLEINIGCIAWHETGCHNTMCDLLFYKHRLLNLIQDLYLLSIWRDFWLCYRERQKKRQAEIAKSGEGEVYLLHLSHYFSTCQKPHQKTLTDYPGASWIQAISLPVSRMSHQFFFRGKCLEYSPMHFCG